MRLLVCKSTYYSFTRAGFLNYCADKKDRPVGPQAVIQLSAKASVLNHSIPNFFFHLQTAYAILRSKGVPLGKRDFIGSFLAQ